MTMRLTTRVAVVLATALAAVLVSAAPAMAGNWAVTTLDPLPDRIEPGRAYTIGFWVLQHGSHPYHGGTLDPVALKFVDGKGAATVYKGVALAEPAHYATAVVFPGPGTWQVFGVQGPFQDYRVGTLTVPGGLTALPVPQPATVGTDEQPWGAIRPPQMPVDTDRDPFGDAGAAAPAGAPSPAAAVRRTADHRPTGPSTVVAVTVALAVAGLALALGRRGRWPRRPSEPRRELVG
jgi:hypothetical protein